MNPNLVNSAKVGDSIESGYFVFTLMPSLYCELNCPHCYLSKEQRRDKQTLSVDSLRLTCEKVDAYYRARGIKNKTIVCYWYGGEPTSMGAEYFTQAADAINAVFSVEKGYQVRHTVLTSLVAVDLDVWLPLFRKYGHGEFQSSYDGLMRGKGYMRKWEANIRRAIAEGMRVSTISVVNQAILMDGPHKTIEYLTDLGIQETSWLPFMLNDQNNGTGAYEEYAPRMNEYSDFMIAMTKRWFELRSAGAHPPEIGQMRFILHQGSGSALGNIAGQTLFLMPNGDFVLPDYKAGWHEFMQPFGNILEQSFEQVLHSEQRRKYLRRQILRNGNAECLSCDRSSSCVMEFWKENRPGDDCFGAKRYVDWLFALDPKVRADFEGCVLY